MCIVEEGKLELVYIIQSIDQGPFQLGVTRDTLGTTPKRGVLLGPERARTYDDLNDNEKKRFDADVRATNIVLQGLPKDTYQASIPITTLKFVTAVKLNKGLKETNHEQLYAYLKQHEKHAAQDRLIIERITPPTNDPLAFVSSVQPYSQPSQSQSLQYQSSTTPSQSQNVQSMTYPQFAEPSSLDTGYTQTDEILDTLTKQFALLTQSFRATLPQTNNQLRTSSNTRNLATIQDGQIVVQNVQGRQNQNQRNFARGNGVAGFGGTQNRAGNANAGQGKPIKCYNCNGIGHIARNCTQPKRPQNSDYFKDKMLLMQAQENGAVLDEEELLFLVGEQPNTFDADVDNQPVRDLARNEDNIFQADECDAFDSDVDDEPTAQSIFMANLSSAGPTNLQASSSDASILSEVPDLENANVASNNDQVEHEIHSEVQQSTVIDSNNADMGNSNVIPYEQYLTTNDVSVVPSCASSAPNTAYVLIDNNVHTPNEPLVTKLAIYKEQVAIYEQRAKFELTEREQRMDDQMRILIQDRNRMKEKLKQELHSVKLQLNHSIKSQTVIQENVNTLQQTFKQRESQLLNDFSNLRKLKDKLKNKLHAQDQSIQTVHMMLKPKKLCEQYSKIAIGAQNPFYLKKAKVAQPTLYDGNEIINPNHNPTNVPSSEEGLELAELARQKMHEKMNDPVCVEKRINVQKSLVTEVRAMKIVFENMEAEVDQNTVDKKCGEIERRNLLIINENLIVECLSKDVFYTATDSVLYVSRFSDMHDAFTIAHKCIADLESENFNLRNKIQNDDHDSMIKHFSKLEVEHFNLQLKYQNLKERFGNKKPVTSSDAPSFDSLFVIGKLNEQIQNPIFDLKALVSQNKDLTAKLNALHDLNERFRAENAKVKQHYKELYPIDVDQFLPSSRRIGSMGHIYYIKHLKEKKHRKTLRENNRGLLTVERPLDTSLASTCRYTKHSQELLEYVLPTKQWKPTGRLLLLRRQCPLVRSTTLKSDCMPADPQETIALVVQIVLWYLDSGCSKHMTGDRSWLRNFMKKFIGTVRFRNDHFGSIIGYGDYVIGDSVISRVYYVEGLGHNLFFVGQFCDSDLKVAFKKHTCFVRDLDGVDLIKGSRGTNLYTIFVEDMMRSSPICLLSKASKNKSWLWHRRLNHLNFGTLNDLSRKDLVRGLPRLKFENDHLCSACQLGKSRKPTCKPKMINTITEVLHTLHMDLCGPLRVHSINGKRYILVIVDDYSRFTWVMFLRSKDETPAFVINLLKQLQVGLNKIVWFMQTDNGTEFVNKDLTDYYESVGITYEKTIPRTP
ncbi:retrovirus-related pol polyprotein from transposon TNT 1-94 [Tanacetum coccineum]